MEHTGASMGGFAEATQSLSMHSNATVLPNAEDRDCGLVLLNGGGTWIGHVGPGLLFLLWGFWWTVNIFLAHLRQPVHALGKPFSCSSYYPSPWSHGRLIGWTRHWEAITLTWGPLFMVWLELKGDHQAYTNLLCTNGRFDPRHIHNWQHAANYPAFFVSGVVNLLGNFVALPDGTQHSFLGLAFSIEGAIMLMHSKHHPLDAVAHWLLGMAMLSTAAFVLFEIKARCDLLLSTAKAGSLMLTGCWLCVMGKMLFTDARADIWSQDNGASAMMAPAVFAMLLLAVAVFQLMLFVSMQALFNQFGQGKALYAVLPVSPKAAQRGKLDAATLTQHELGSPGVDDSANERSDSGSEAPSSQVGHSAVAGHHFSPSNIMVPPQNKQPKAVKDVLSVLAKPVKGSLGNGPLRLPSASKQKADHIV